jgi:hypothetical protein
VSSGNEKKMKKKYRKSGAGGSARRRGFARTVLPLGVRTGLQRKARRICISKSGDLQRKARFFAALAAKNAPFYEKNPF